MRDESSASNADVTVIPSQLRVTQQILSHWQPFLDLKLMFTGSRRTEQLSLHSQQRIVATVEDSVLRTEMGDLESQEEDAPKRCCERRLNCSARREPANISLRSWKVFQWLSICWVTLCCEVVSP